MAASPEKIKKKRRGTYELESSAISQTPTSDDLAPEKSEKADFSQITFEAGDRQKLENGSSDVSAALKANHKDLGVNRKKKFKVVSYASPNRNLDKANESKIPRVKKTGVVKAKTPSTYDYFACLMKRLSFWFNMKI